jgi:hypothetical protein
MIYATVKIKVMDFCDVIPYSSVDRYQRFGETYCLVKYRK